MRYICNALLPTLTLNTPYMYFLYTITYQCKKSQTVTKGATFKSMGEKRCESNVAAKKWLQFWKISLNVTFYNSYIYDQMRHSKLPIHFMMIVKF